jgi:hypothetical protein
MFSRLSGICLLLTLVLLSGCATSTQNRMLQEGKSQLNADQIYQAVSGNTLYLEAIDFSAWVHFLDNGRVSARNRSNNTDTGKWDINSDKQLCMKFNVWFYGDERCFSMVEEGTGRYVLFTTNGARAYSATAGKGDTEKLAKTARKKDKTYLREQMAGGGEAAEDSRPPQTVAATPTRVTPAPPPPPEEIRHTLATMARNCPNCNLAGADLKGVDLITANLAGANLAGADLSGANLRRANLAGANLAGAILVNTNLPGANLANCNMSEADLSGANLIKANFTGAMTEGVILQGAHLEGVIGLEGRK